MTDKASELFVSLNPSFMVEALTSSGVGIWYWNIQSGETWFDKSWLHMLGLSEENAEANLNEWSKRLHPDDRQMVMQEVDDFIRQRVPVYQTAHRLMTADGSYIWVRDTGKVISFDEQGRPLIAIGTHVNIDKLKAAEEESRELLQQHELMSKVATELNYSKDFDYAVNKALAMIGEFVKVSRIYIFEDDKAKNTTSNTFEWCGSGISPQIEDLQDFPYEIIPSWPLFLDRNGMVTASDIYTELPEDMIEVLGPQDIKSIVILPIEYARGDRIGFIGFDHCYEQRHWRPSEIELLKSCAGFLSNAYKRKMASNELEAATKKAMAASQAKSLFISKVSHELRTPLNSILGYSTLMQQHTLDHKLNNFVKSIHSNSRHLKSLIDDLLDFTKLESNRMMVNPSEFNIRTMISDLVNAIQVNLLDDVVLKVEIDPAIPDWLIFDRLKLHQMINNILSNALKFTNRGEIALQLQKIGGTGETLDLMITVTDTGAGIAEDKIDRIFDAFEQAGQDDYASGRGTGLGLPIVKAYVELLKGEISLTSVKGEGTRVSLIFRNIQMFWSHTGGEQGTQPVTPETIKRDTDGNQLGKLMAFIACEVESDAKLEAALTGLYREEFQMARSTRRIASIAGFNERLGYIAEEHASPNLKKMNVLISRCLDVFDIDQLEKTLQVFDDKMQELTAGR